jgi:formate hydrogenlyase subunit 3/multisubunit Na+/H+ antiporter MnhD subunit
VIETGLYAMTRVFYLLFDPGLFGAVMAALSFITMTFANILALLQDDIKRMLAYSSIAQIGYMLIGVATGTGYGVMGTFLHVFNHSLMKGLAFLAAGNIVHEAGTRDIKRLVGVGRRMPYTAFTLLVAFLGLGGVPSTSGFISKFILFSSAIGAGMPLLAVVGVLNSAFSMAYYLRVLKTLVSTPIEEVEEIQEAPPMMLLVTLIMALLIILFGIYPAPTLRYASAASRALVERWERYMAAVVTP